MTRLSTTLAACALLAAGGAQAQAWFSAGAYIYDPATNTSTVVGPAENTSVGPFTTGGLQSVSAGVGSAAVNAWAEPAVGMTKSFVSASVLNPVPPAPDPSDLSAPPPAPPILGSTGAFASMQYRDELVFSGTTAFVNVSITLSWDTTVSGLGPEALRGGTTGRMSLQSSQWVSLSYAVPDPRYGTVPGCPPGVQFAIGNSEVMCPFPTKGIYASDKNDIYGVVDSSGYADGATDGIYQGQKTFSMNVPVDTPVTLNYSVLNQVICDGVSACNLASDATHSDYLGITVDTPGASLASAQGYQYLGRAGLAAPVPEPSGAALALAGLALLGARRVRRRQA